ncbi:MAG: hypothetical protein J7578_18625, partial [Chitinophagaceae bacterium]|nr:hypothetical protein [Chitinophagaceae bacterium]
VFNVYSGGDYMLVTWGSSRMDAMTPEERYTYKSDLNTLFLQRAHELNAVKTQPAFTALTDYSAVNSTNWRQLGLVDQGANTPQKDLDAYLKVIVSNSFAKATAPGGYLHPSFDVNGVIRKKYDIVISYFINAFGVDLQAIGNEGA